MEAKKQQMTQTAFRISKDMQDILRLEAEKNGRTVGEEIRLRLQYTIEQNLRLEQEVKTRVVARPC